MCLLVFVGIFGSAFYKNLDINPCRNFMSLPVSAGDTFYNKDYFLKNSKNLLILNLLSIF